MVKWIKSLFENAEEHRCQICGEVYKGSGSFDVSESCSYSHDQDDSESQEYYPKVLRQYFQSRKSAGETRGEFILMVNDFWSDPEKVSKEDRDFCKKILWTYMKTGIRYDLLNDRRNLPEDFCFYDEVCRIYDELNQKVIL